MRPTLHAFTAARRFSASSSQRIVVAVGGNALQRRGERLTIENQLKAAKDMAPAIAALAKEHEVVLTHGNGPQVGELALERSCAPFDVLGAESQGQIGYILARAFQSIGVDTVPIVTQTLVDAADPAFNTPTKFVGPVYGAKEAEALAKQLDWTVKQDGEYYRRVVPSPRPHEILQLGAVRALLESPANVLVVACGGGGAPVSRVFGDIVGVEAVIDKDMTGALLGRSLGANGLIILTDGGGIWENFGKPNAREMKRVTPAYLTGVKAGAKFPGSMGPKITAAIDFVVNSERPDAWAAIADLKDAAKVFTNEEGTMISKDIGGGDVIWHARPPSDPTPPAEDGPDAVAK